MTYLSIETLAIPDTQLIHPASLSLSNPVCRNETLSPWREVRLVAVNCHDLRALQHDNHGNHSLWSHPVWRNQALSLSSHDVVVLNSVTTWVQGNIITMATILSAMPLAICMMTSPTRVLIGLDRSLIINENLTEWRSLPVWREKKPLSYLEDSVDTRRVRSIAILNIALTIWPSGYWISPQPSSSILRMTSANSPVKLTFVVN